jgi:circadian clock protein KaiC
MENDIITSFEETKTKPSKFELRKSKTGIKGLDDITYGGIPENRPTVLVGAAGTGKTVLAMQYIINGILMYNEPGVFMTFEEKPDELQTNFSTMGLNISTHINENKLYLERLHVDQNEIHQSGKFNIDGLFVRLLFAIEKVKAKRLVLDSLDTLFEGFENRIIRSEFKRLFFWLKEKNVTAIITAEGGETFLSRFGLEEVIADCVLQLNIRVLNQIATRRLRIVKYRGSFHSNNEYPFHIDQNGVTIFPEVSESPQIIVSSERISSGVKQLDEMLDKKGYYIGSSILISGPAGTGKTSVASSFAINASQKNRITLYCAFEEAPNQIIRNMKTIGLSFDQQIKDEKFHFYYSRPTLHNLELHLIAIKKMIHKIKATAIILDPITNIMEEDINSDMRTMLIKFIDYLKMEQITVLVTATITPSSLELIQSNEGISSLVDTCIMIKEDCTNGIHHKYLYVMKSRGINNSKKEFEFEISADGIKIIPLDNLLLNGNGSLNNSQKNLKKKFE